MGRHLLNALIADTASERHIYILNRGTRYWGTNYPFDLHGVAIATHIPMDRDVNESVLSAFQHLAADIRGLESSRSVSTLSICDFSCDDEGSMERVWEGISAAGLASRVVSYTLISTDSVYKKVSTGVVSGTSTAVFESSLCVPFDRRGYAGEKIRAERAFSAAIATFSPTISWYILRLPDVIGPFDNSGRYWATVLWAVSGVPLLLESSVASIPLSLVSGADVANLCFRLLSHNSGIPSGIYNLACQENFTVRQMIDHIAHGLGVPPPRVFRSLRRSESSESSSSSSDDDHSDVSADFYPSVDCGPISIRSAIQNLGWCPTPLVEVLSESTRFFVDRPRLGKEFSSAFRKLPPMVRAALQAK